jgi:hypothetical protein
MNFDRECSMFGSRLRTYGVQVTDQQIGNQTEFHNYVESGIRSNDHRISGDIADYVLIDG